MYVVGGIALLIVLHTQATSLLLAAYLCPNVSKSRNIITLKTRTYLIVPSVVVRLAPATPKLYQTPFIFPVSCRVVLDNGSFSGTQDLPVAQSERETKHS